ncbi:hydrolase Nlp/P60 [Hanamia caeni]|uniref:Hydrolase Nlp/P60 n=1 Tax=Hanamia caeni TaxID=2294116 RepID=A0A3M9NRU7_9BACT|nr:C40 family peptidase [Hanamia caeni]RNI39923.1 hydrolase Nlp/P60 [Hanamia caeni]
MEYLVCCVGASPMRSEPSHKSEMVSQQLFGEKSFVIEKKDDWIKIQLRFDGYEGWVQQSHVVPIDEDIFNKNDKGLTQEWINEVDYNGHIMYVPMGSAVSAFKNGTAFWRKNLVHFKGKTWEPEEIKINAKLIKQIAFKFLNTSYLWGGKSVFGIDCSGYTQMVYKFLNYSLPRDAWQQAEQGTAVNFLQEAHCGDLAFFDNEEGRITHVGILLNENEIIHSAGKVRIDKIDTEGILNLETKQRTHKLRIIKRYF